MRRQLERRNDLYVNMVESWKRIKATKVFAEKKRRQAYQPVEKAV